MRVCYAFGWCVVFKIRYPMLDKLGQIVWQTRQHCLIILILIFHFVPTITFYRVSNSLVASADAFLLILSFAFHFIWQRNVLPPPLPPSLPLSLSLWVRVRWREPFVSFRYIRFWYLCICKSESAACRFVFVSVSVCVSNKFSNCAINSRF